MWKATFWISLTTIGLSGCDEKSISAPPTETGLGSAVPTQSGEPTATPAAVPASLAPRTPSPAAARAVPVRLQALGTEPFWGVRIEGSKITYTTPEDQAGQTASVSRHETAGGSEFSGKLGSAAIHVEVSRKNCSDGMSDRVYPFAVVLTLAAKRLSGCAAPID